jgi:hypothetical protein
VNYPDIYRQNQFDGEIHYAAGVRKLTAAIIIQKEENGRGKYQDLMRNIPVDRED